MRKIICIIFVELFLVGNAIGAVYILPKGTTIYTSQFQMESSSSLSKEAFSGWFEDQAKTGQITFAPMDIPVVIIDECSWCSGYSVRVSATNGNFKGWVYKGHLKKGKPPEAERKQTQKNTTLAMGKRPSVSTTKESGRDGRFIAHKNGTVLDTRTNLMWAAKDNGSKINWANAKSYCEKYRGGGYTDWRMPTQAELTVLYDETKTYMSDCGYEVHVTELIRLTCIATWTSETRGFEANSFTFFTGEWRWMPQSTDASAYRALPVRSVK